MSGRSQNYDGGKAATADKRRWNKRAPGIGSTVDLRPRREVQSIGRHQSRDYDEHGRKKTR